MSISSPRANCNPGTLLIMSPPRTSKAAVRPPSSGAGFALGHRAFHARFTHASIGFYESYSPFQVDTNVTSVGDIIQRVPSTATLNVNMPYILDDLKAG